MMTSPIRRVTHQSAGEITEFIKEETMADAYDIPDEELDKRILWPSPTMAAFFSGYRYSLWKDIKERAYWATYRLQWRWRWRIFQAWYGDRLLGFSGGLPLLRGE